MDIDELKLGQIKEIRSLFPAVVSSHPYELGSNYLLRTVTMINAGRLVAVTEKELVLEDASWIADTGRFADALISCEFYEVEPFPEGQVIVSRGALVDAVKIASLPRSQK